jgi:carbon monoxide dehydrogenase subunit G
MEFDNSFDVPLAPAQAWSVLMDVPRIAPCMPGAELTEVVDPQNFGGKISVRLGPVSLTFAGRVQIDSIDEANHSARVKAQGNDAKGRGGANATATFHIEPAGTGSKVLIHTDLMLSGAVAQYGRGVGMIQATAAQIINQFAGNLRTQFGQQAPAPAAVAARPPPEPAAVAPAAVRPEPAPAAQAPPRVPVPLVPPARSAPPPPAKPISGFSLIARVLWQQIVGLFTGRRQ